MRARFRTGVIFLTVFCAALAPTRARAASSIPLDPGSFPDINRLLDAATANTIITGIGIMADHRPYEPATPLLWTDGNIPRAGFDISAELTLVHIPDEFLATLKRAGINQSISIHALPVPKVHIHKGISQKVDIGLSAIKYQEFQIIGGDLKVALNSPADEAPTVAFRISYTDAKLGFVKSRTITPQFVASRAMDFADPYIGLGYQIVSGKLDITVPAPPGVDLGKVAKDGGGGSALAFMGVGFRIFPLKLTIEGAYSTGDAHSLGMKFGFAF